MGGGVITRPKSLGCSLDVRNRVLRFRPSVADSVWPTSASLYHSAACTRGASSDSRLNSLSSVLQSGQHEDLCRVDEAVARLQGPLHCSLGVLPQPRRPEAHQGHQAPVVQLHLRRACSL